MTHFLLIHGSWHGAWCWYKISPRLQALGHRVSAPDLPGRRNHPGRTHFTSLSVMEKAAAQYLPETEKTVILVHSRYGVLASRLAEIYPERIARVIYLAAYMLPSGASAAEYFRRDKASSLLPFVEISKTGMWDRLNPKIYRQGLYHDCSAEDNMLGKMLLVKEPLRPALSKLRLTEDRYGQVPKAYIRLLQDRAVSLSLQDNMITKSPPDRVESLDASHSAYFSKPEALTQTVLKLAGA